MALQGRRDAYVRSALVAAMLLGGVCAFLQPLSGDLLAKFVFKTQPVKFAAMEGQFKTERHAPLRIGGWPDEEKRETMYAIEIPGGLSFIATGDSSAEVPGLDQVEPHDWPNIELTHLAFQVMVGLGSAMAAASLWALFALGRKRLYDSRALLRLLAIVTPFGFIATEAGWMVTEIGRQPWVVSGVVKTADAVTPMTGLVYPMALFTILYLGLSAVVVLVMRSIVRTT